MEEDSSQGPASGNDRTEVTDSGQPVPLVYGEIDNGLVFLPERRAYQLVLLIEALKLARTWQELRDLVSDELWEEIRERRDAYDIARSSGELSEAFDPEELAGYSIGAWPSWPAQDMLELLPRDLVQAYGQITDTLMDGYFLRIDEAHEDELTGELRARGWKCRRDDLLVMEASGYD